MKFIKNFTTTNNKFLLNCLKDKINRTYHHYSNAYVNISTNLVNTNMNFLYIGGHIYWKIVQLYKIPMPIIKLTIVKE